MLYPKREQKNFQPRQLDLQIRSEFLDLTQGSVVKTFGRADHCDGHLRPHLYVGGIMLPSGYGWNIPYDRFSDRRLLISRVPTARAYIGLVDISAENESAGRSAKRTGARS